MRQNGHFVTPRRYGRWNGHRVGHPLVSAGTTVRFQTSTGSTTLGESCMNEFAVSCRLVLALTFLLSAVGKLRSPGSFAISIERHGVIQGSLARWIAWLIIATELGVGIILLGGRVVGIGLILAATLLIVFLIVMIRNISRQEPLPCHCFGSSDDTETPAHAVYRILLLMVVLAVAVGASWDGVEVSGIPHASEILLAVSLMIVGIWSLQVPELVHMHQLLDLETRSRSKRVSFRNTPLTPVSIERTDGSE